MPYRLLSVGTQLDLLTTRNAVLQQAGYLVRSSSKLDDAAAAVRKEDFEAAILCHSIPEKEREALVRLLKEAKPQVPVVVVSNGTSTRAADAEIHSLDGPEELLRLLAEILAKTAADRQKGRTN